jgi:hypothetical protein
LSRDCEAAVGRPGLVRCATCAAAPRHDGATGRYTLVRGGRSTAAGKPNASALQTAWKTRRRGRASPVLLIALYSNKAALCGPAGEDPPVRLDVNLWCPRGFTAQRLFQHSDRG